MTIRERLLSKVEIDRATHCWRWRGQLHPSGYGYLKFRGRQRRAHRVAYEAFIGPIPDGLHLDHVRGRGCRYRDCINPDHLEPVTPRENLMRSDTTHAARNARKPHCPRCGLDYERDSAGDRACHHCHRLKTKEMRVARVRAGLCRECGAPIAGRSKTLCDVHAERGRLASAAYRAARKVA